jgi:hypothetical protein
MAWLMGGVMKIDLNKIPSCDRTTPQTKLSLRKRQSKAGKLLGPISWESEVVGYAQCPGRHLHTTVTSSKDCRVTIDNVPTIFCFHQRCFPIIAPLNQKLRSKTGEGRSFGPTRKRSQTKAVQDGLKQRAKDYLPHILQECSWTPAEAFEESPTTLGDKVHQDWQLHLNLFTNAEGQVWIGSEYDSGKPRHARNFKTPEEWLGRSRPLGAFTCPSTFKTGAISRSNKQVASQPFLVLESDTQSHGETCSLFKWMRKILKLRAIVNTGNKSLHGWFEGPTPEQRTELKAILPEWGFDRAMFTPSQPCRLAGVTRPNSSPDPLLGMPVYQSLLWLDLEGIA